MEEGSAQPGQEIDNAAPCLFHDVSEASVSSQLSPGGVEDDDLELPGVDAAADLFAESNTFSFPPLDAAGGTSPSQLTQKVLKGRDLFLSKACEDDSDAQSDSPLTSPFPGYPDYTSESQSEFSRPSQLLERTGPVYPAPYSYSTGFGHFPKRGRGRPRKDPFSPAAKKTRGRGLGRKGRPVQSSQLAYRQAWLASQHSQRSMDTSDPADSEDGSSSAGRAVASTSTSELTLAASAGDDTSDSQGSGRSCGFCACVEKSLLGQGDLFKFEATVGFTPSKRMLKSQRGSSESEEQSREKSPKHLTWRRPRGPMKGSRERSRSPRQQSVGEEDSNALSLTDELALVGFTEDVEFSIVFDENGAVYAHYCCAVWSENVDQSEGKLKFVDRAVFSGLVQKCGYCRRYGASLACRSPRCTRKFHFPCASAGNCFQDLKTLSLLCPDHVDQAEIIAGNDAYCIQCNELGNVSEQLFCTSCGQHYHGNCLCPPVEIKPIVRAGWQCPNCKICQTCRQPGDDIKMLVCDTCDKGYHTFCLKPAMTTIPKNGWKCKNCRICSDCGARTPGNGPSSRWHLNYSVCDSCYQQRNKGLCCPLCGKAYRHFQNKNMMVPCSSCKKHVHSECDSAIDSGMLQRVKQGETIDYICQVCRESDPMDIEPYALTAPSGTDESLESFPLTKADSDLSLKDNPMLTEATLTTASSQESLYCEDSNSSLDYDTDKTYVPHRDDVYGHKLYISRKKQGSSRSRSRGMGSGEKRRHRPLSLGEKRRGPRVKIKTSLSVRDHSTTTSAPTTPVPHPLPQGGELVPAADTPPNPSSGGTSPSSQQHGSVEKKEKDDDDEGDDHPATMIICESKDKFVLNQDVCKSCGSFGLGDEAKMIVCTQCGQCYHPYCVSVKVTRVILKKGWRCLDCTVCEGCGGPDDEGRLLLCDDCDISYHTYCLQPPLKHVPQGNWKCKWCVRCLYCGSTSPGTGCHWMSNYTKCGPCHSKLSCPVCCRHYREEELIIQCVHCDRWLHCMCDGLRNEDEAELAADYGYHCLYCRPKTGKTGPLPPPPPPPPPPPVEEEIKLASPPASIYEPDRPRQYLIDGVYLLANGMQQIQSQIVPLPKVKRKPKPQKPKLPFGARTPRHFSLDGEDSFDKDDEMKLFEGLEPGELPSGAMTPELTPEEEAKIAKMKRQRKQVGFGVGGFMIRQLTRKFAKRQTSVEEHHEELPPGAEGEMSLLQDKPKKKPRKSKKGKLEESFPGYLQEAFFGIELTTTSKYCPVSSKELLHSGSDSDTPHNSSSRPSSPSPMPSTSSTTVPSAGLDGDGELKGLGAGEMLLMGRDRQATPMSPSHGSDGNDLEEGDSDFLPKDILQLFEMDTDLEGGADGSKDKGEESEKEGDPDNLEKILNSKNIDVDRMLSEGLMQFDGVDDIFTGVLKSDDDSQPQLGTGADHDSFHLPPGMAGPSHGDMSPHHGAMAGVRIGPQGQLLKAPHGGGPDDSPGHEIPPFNIPPMFQQPRSMSTCSSPEMGTGMPGVSQTMSPWPPGPSGDDDDVVGGSSKRSILKWETDEALGLNATISAVLYVNTSFPTLRAEYPEWSERSKQIAKLWRKLKPEEKMPFLAKARKNRTSHRVQKAQKQVSQELKRRQEAQMLQDSEAMPPPPAPPPLHGQLPAPGDPFSQPPGPHDPPEALSPSMRNPLQNAGGPGPPPFQRWPDDPFNKPPTMDHPPDSFSPTPPHARQGVGAQTHESFPFSPGTPKHDSFAMGPGTPRPRLQHQSFEQFVRGPGSQGASPSGSPLPPDDPFGKGPMPPRMFGALHGGVRGKQEEHPGTSQPHDPYAFSPSTPQPSTSQDDVFHGPMRLPLSAPDTFPGPSAAMQAGLGQRPSSESGDMFHGLPPGAMVEAYGPKSGSPSAHASPVHTHSMASTPPRPGQYALSPGHGGMASPMRHPEAGFPPEGLRSPHHLQRSNSLPHSYQGVPPRLPMDPALSRSMSEVSPEQYHPRMMPPQDPALVMRRYKLGPHGPYPWPPSLVPPPSVTKLRMQQKAAQQIGQGHPLHQQWLQQQQQQEAGMGPGSAGMPPSSMMPRMPGAIPGFRDMRPGQPGMPPERWPMDPRMVRPPNPQHFSQEAADGFSPRGPHGESGIMRFPHPQQQLQRSPGPLGMPGMMPPGMQRPPANAFQQSQQQGVSAMMPDLHHSQAQEDEVFRQLESHRAQLMVQPPTKQGEEGPGEAGGSQDRTGAEGADSLLPVDKDLKPSISSEDDKPEDDDLLKLISGADGTFDILKYADPELDLDDPNLIDSLDLMDDPKASSGEGEGEGEDKKDDDDSKSDDKKALESAVEGAVKADGDPDGEGSEGDSKTKDFQSQFLQFSQRRQHQIEDNGKASTQTGEGDKDDKSGVSHIAALLQGTKPIATRPDQVGEGGKMAGTDPSMLSGTIQSMLQRPPFTQGMPGQGPGGQQMSPQAVPGPSGLPSPKITHSPRSGQPSPRTPGIQSPYSQVISGRHSVSPHSQPLTPGGQMSPFSQHGSGQSPFSPPISSAQSPFGASVSAPQSPYAIQGPSRTMSPFTMPVSVGQLVTSQPGPLQHLPHPQPPPQMLASRATITPTNQYNQGSYSQPLGALGPPPRGGTLTPTPSSILYGQSAATQHAMRPQGPRPFMPGQDLGGDGVELGEQRLTNHALQQMMQRFPGGPPVSMAPGVRPPPSTHLRLHPPFSLPPGHRLLSPVNRPQGPLGALAQRVLGPSEQKTLLDELLEQEKQEQKKQAEQQAMLHRPGQPPDISMAGGPRPGMIPQQHPGMPPHGIPPRMGGPEGGWPGGPRQVAPGDMPPGQQFPPGFGPRMPGQPMGPHGPMPPFPSPQLQQQQQQQGQQQGQPMLPPPPPQPPVPQSELAPSPEYDRQVLQYEDWLSKTTQYLDLQVKMLEQQIQKQKRAKKTIQARQRQARKNNQEINPKDALELERVAAEQAEIQKQLETQRKQSRQHQVVVQDYYNKQKEQFGGPTWSGPMGMPPRPMGAPPGSGPPPGGPPGPVATATSTSATVMLQPRVPGSPSSIRMSHTARQEYDAYMQSRLRMAQQAPRPRAPTTIQLGDNNPFSETFQVREQLIKKQETGDTPVTSPLSQPPTTPTQGTPTGSSPVPGPPSGPGPGIPGPDMPGPGMPGPGPGIPVPRIPGPGPSGGVRPPPPPPQAGEGIGPMFFRERNMDGGPPRFMRPPGPFGDGAPRPEGPPRLPAYSGPGSHPGMLMENQRMPFPQGMPMPSGQGFGHPGMPMPHSGAGDMGVPPTQPPVKEKPKKRRKKKKADDNDNAQSQPLPPSMPSQSMISSSTQHQQGESRPSTTGSNIPKPPEFPIKPQSETDRRILEILSNTAALAAGENQQSSTKGGNSKGARSKSPAAAAGTGHKSAPEKEAEGQGSSDGQGEGGKQVGQGPVTSVGGPPSSMPPSAVSTASVQTTTSIPGSVAGDTPLPPGPPFQQHPRHMGSGPHPSYLHPGHPAHPGHPGHPGHPMMSVSGPHPHGLPPGVMMRPGMPHHPGHPMNMPPRGSPFHHRMPHGMQLPEGARLPPHLMHRPSGVAVSMAQQHPGLARPPRPPPPPVSTALQERPGEGMGTAVTAPQPLSAKPLEPSSSQPAQSLPPMSKPAPGGDAASAPPSSTAQPPQQPPTSESLSTSSASTPPAVPTSETPGSSSAEQQTPRDGEKTDASTSSQSAPKEEEPSATGSKEGESKKKVCDDGIHCGTDDEAENPTKKVCDDGIHCGTDDEAENPTKKVCDDGIHCGTDDEAENPTKKVCDDGIHCGTDDEAENPTKKVCDDGIHCGTDDEAENPTKKVCDDGIHCGTDDEAENPTKKVCDDGIHCGTDDEAENPTKKVCDDGIHCGTDDEAENPTKKVCDDGIHCGTDDEEDKPSKKTCDDGIHCGTDDEAEAGSSKKKVCDDGLHCVTDDEEEQPKKVCSDGIHCGTDDEDEKPKKKVCDDGIHCGTDDEAENPIKKVCNDGIHCGTDDEEEKTTKKVCDDGIHCGTDDEDEKPKKKVCDDGIHCGTDDEEDKPTNKVCDDGIHCGTDDEAEAESSKKKICDDGLHCGTDDEEDKPTKKVCDDGIHCGTDDEEDKPTKKVCDDGIHCGTDDEEEKPKKKVCDDGIHCGTDDENETGKEATEEKPENSEVAVPSTSAATTASPPVTASVASSSPTATTSRADERNEEPMDTGDQNAKEPLTQSETTVPPPPSGEQGESVSDTSPPQPQVDGAGEGSVHISPPVATPVTTSAAATVTTAPASAPESTSDPSPPPPAGQESKEVAMETETSNQESADGAASTAETSVTETAPASEPVAGNVSGAAQQVTTPPSPAPQPAETDTPVTSADTVQQAASVGSTAAVQETSEVPATSSTTASPDQPTPQLSSATAAETTSAETPPAVIVSTTVSSESSADASLPTEPSTLASSVLTTTTPTSASAEQSAVTSAESSVAGTSVNTASTETTASVSAPVPATSVSPVTTASEMPPLQAVKIEPSATWQQPSVTGSLGHGSSGANTQMTAVSTSLGGRFVGHPVTTSMMQRSPTAGKPVTTTGPAVPYSAGSASLTHPSTTTSHSRPYLPPLSIGDSMHYPPDHPLAGQPRPPLDMLAKASQSALSSAGSSIPTSLASTQPSPPTPGSRQQSPEMMRFSRHMTPQMAQHLAQQGISGPPSSQHSPTMVYGGEGGYIPRHMFPGGGMGPRYRGMAPPGEYPQGRGMMSPPAMSPTSPQQRGQRPQFPPYHPDMMHPGMPPRSMGPRPMMPPEMMGRTSAGHEGMMPPHLPGYGHPPGHSQAMMNRPPYAIHPSQSSGAMDFPPRPHHPSMSMAGFPGHRMPAGGHQSAPHSPSSTSPLRMQGGGFPPDPRMMSPDPHHLIGQGDPRMAANLRMFAEQQQRLGMMRQRHPLPMMPPGGGAAAFPPHQRPPPPRMPMFPEEGMDPFHPLHHPRSTPPDTPHMPTQASMSPMRPPFPEAVSLAPSSSLGPMMSSPGAVSSSAGMDVKGLDITINQAGMAGGMMVKTEAGLDVPDLVGMEGMSRDMDPEQRAKHNALLKQLLSKEAAFRGDTHPPSTPDSEESLPMLTPEQQRQLELIDMMPLCKETDTAADITDWDNKTAEEREQLLETSFSLPELRKQEYEKKRKAYEAVRKKRKGQPGQPGQEGAVPGPTPKVKRRRKTGTAPVDPNSLGVTDLSEPVPVKKRGRRNKVREQRLEQRESELEFMAETFLQQLHSLPSVSLREPDITLLYSIVPIRGAPKVTGVSSLHGAFGQGYLDTEFDVYRSLCFPPPPPTLQPVSSSTTHARLLGEKATQHSPDIVTCVAGPAPTPVVETSPIATVAGQTIPLETGPFPLPAHPRIEVKTEPLRDTPDTIISSSSPECGFEEKEADFSSLRFIDPASPGSAVDDKFSPTVPLLHPIATYPSAKMEKGEVLDVKPPLPHVIPLPPPPPHTSVAAAQTISTEALQPVAAKQEMELPSPLPDIPSQDLTVKLPTITSGLAHPFINPTLDQKVSVTLTLSATAAEDIGGVISAIADLLKIAVPPTYEITRTPSPEMFKLNLTHKEDVINIQALMRTKPTFCGHCHVVLINSGIRKHKSDLPPALVPDDLDPGEEEVTFCSMNCMNQFMQTAPQLEEVDEEEDNEDNSNSTSTSTIIMDSADDQDGKSTKMEVDEVVKTETQLSEVTSPKRSSGVPLTEALSISTSSPALSASASATTQPGTPTTPTAGPSSFSSPAASPAHSLMSPGLRIGPLGSPHHALLSPGMRGKEERGGKRHRRSSSTASQESFIIKPVTKRWRDDRWKRWDTTITLTKTADVTIKDLNELWESLGMVLHPASLPDDARVCSLCHHVGDGEPDGPSRLLNMDVDKWVHLNCALWSYEVYETCNGALMNVDAAFSRGMATECVTCRKMGATLSCFKTRCANSYHLPCARLKGCIFFQDKTIICGNHNSAAKPYADAEMSSIEVRRRVYINRDEEKQVANIVVSLIHPDDGHFVLRIGSLILHAIGQLLPHQIQTNKFNTREFIYPVGFRTTRFYWSHRVLYKRCRYLCSITENQGAPEFVICVQEEGHPDVTYRDTSAKDVWMNIFRPLKEMRKNADMVKMFPEFMCMEELFGLNEPAIVRILESLPGADLLHNYHFKFGRSPLIEMPPAINPTGCARTEPKLRTHFRRPHTLHSSNSRSLPSTVTGVTGNINSPYMKQFVHSKSQQYRRLKTEWKNLVYLGRSRIQGLGLYAARDLEKHTMVIEYIGDLIRNETANRREMEYDNQNRGVYMFRIDNDTVIDATMAGGPARYINHSCSPNCAAEVVHFEKESKIIIITSRRIPKGEELTYDYKFDFEDDQHKIPCMCGAAYCRKWMN
ncbi:histone-lysine N-methyltransferase 2C-like isoform X3 [Littorina saxatilis]|uniref:histone-lysine N-methyltransferase 2C-like isoform X3 n=1 Tax=Littorina saxatilis TaxID=31220 RepID=UPI0038B68200